MVNQLESFMNYFYFHHLGSAADLTSYSINTEVRTFDFVDKKGGWTSRKMQILT